MDNEPNSSLAEHADIDTVGMVAALIGIVVFSLRLACVLLPGVPGAISQLVGLTFGAPAISLGIISLREPRHHTTMAVVGLVLGVLITMGTVGVGIAA